MKKLARLLLPVIMCVVSNCSQKAPDNVVSSIKVPDIFLLIKGGAFKNTKSNFYGKGVTMSNFYISKYEVIQKEWVEVMGSNPSQFKGDSLPVETVSWYDCIDYCNKRSLKEGLKVFYTIDRDKKDLKNKNAFDNIKWTVTINQEANGYRLPTEAEWEYAAGGGQMSKSYTYAGSNKVDDVAWYWANSGDKYLTGSWSWPSLVKNNNKHKTIGGKKPNELGLYDMSGNVREWCWDLQENNGTEDHRGRIWRGGGWMGGDFCCEPFFRADHEASGKGPDQGLRVCRGI